MRGTGHDRFCLSAGKIAAADVMGCYWCDWSDAPDRTDGCYSPVTFGGPMAGSRRSLLSGRAAHRADRRIGSGKSTVSRLLAERGAVIVDADAIAREVVEPGTPGLAAVVDAFGTGVLCPDGSMDRPALAAVVFADPESRQRLDGIVHPLVRARATEVAAAAPPDAVLVNDVPLLVEAGQGSSYDLVLVVEADPETRIARLVQRGLTARTPAPGWRCRRPTRSAGPSPTSSSTTAGPRRSWRARSTVLDRACRAGRRPTGEREEPQVSDLGLSWWAILGSNQ